MDVGLKQDLTYFPSFFVNDSLLFFKGSISEAIQMNNILNVYEQASRQSVNYSKFRIMFSLNIQNVNSDAISSILGVNLRLGNSSYLELSSLVGHNKK